MIYIYDIIVSDGQILHRNIIGPLMTQPLGMRMGMDTVQVSVCSHVAFGVHTFEGSVDCLNGVISHPDCLG